MFQFGTKDYDFTSDCKGLRTCVEPPSTLFSDYNLASEKTEVTLARVGGSYGGGRRVARPSQKLKNFRRMLQPEPVRNPNPIS